MFTSGKYKISKILFFCLFFLLTLTLYRCTLIKPIEAPIKGITLSGYVNDEQGNPVSNCHVIFQRQNWPYSEAVLLTDERGCFYGENIISDQDWIAFDHPNFEWLTIDKSKFTDTKDLKVVLRRKKEIQQTPIDRIDINIQVRNEKGEPITNAKVNYRIGRESPIKTEETDTTGHITLKDIPNEEFNYIDITVTHPEYARTGRTFFRKIKDPNISITLIKPFTITGKVLDASTNIEIQQFDLRWSIKALINGQVGGYQGGLVEKNVQGPNFEVSFNYYGMYKVETRRLYEVCAKAPGYAWGRAQVEYDLEKSPLKQDDVVIFLDRGVTLKGNVTDIEGNPLPKATFLSFDLYYDENQVDEYGHFIIKNWPTYAKKISFSSKGFRGKTVELDNLEEGKTIKLNVKLERFDEKLK